MEIQEMEFRQLLFAFAVAILALMSSPPTLAAVSAEDAAKLKSELTPFGAEKAGDGRIPAWEGGYTKVWPGYRSGEPRPDPFADEKPLFTVTAANMDQYDEQLSDGVKALLKAYPGFRLDVYPTHRTAAAPAWVYDNTFRNATRATPRDGGLTVDGAYGGIPFPIPQTGREAMWNHMLAWRGEAAVTEVATYVATGNAPLQTQEARAEFQYPYYYRDGSAAGFNGVFSMMKVTTLEPPAQAGELYLVHSRTDRREIEQMWAYLVGQHRVRPAPLVAYDTPDPATSGLLFVDEVRLFKGAMDRYDWRILGKRKMFVPYNTQAFHQQTPDKVLGKRHPNPDHLRWELHRVWVIEARLAPGRRHAVARRLYYLDEDTWFALLYDGWDARGRLWHVGYTLPMLVPELPAVVVNTQVTHDLLEQRYMAYLYKSRRRQYEIVPRRADGYFSPAALAGEGVR